MVETQVDGDLTFVLRERILAGAYTPGAPLREAHLAAELGLSRTPVRLALAALEQEGLLSRTPNRGFRLRAFGLDEITDAVLVRGELEGMAARLVAERGTPPELIAALHGDLARADRIGSAAELGPEGRRAWSALNRSFHDRIVVAAGNAPLLHSYERLCRMPLASPAAIVFDARHPEYGRRQIARAQDEHAAIADALVAGEGARAGALLREHAHRSATARRRNLVTLGIHAMDPVPGLALVDLPEVAA